MAAYAQPSPRCDAESRDLELVRYSSTNAQDNGRWDAIHAPSITSHLGATSRSTTLPRADGGKDAWLALAGCFMLEALVSHE